VSDCEELVGVTNRRKDVACWWRWRESNQRHQIVYNYMILLIIIRPWKSLMGQV